MKKEYPDLTKLKVEWTWVHISFISISTLVVTFSMYGFLLQSMSLLKGVSIFALGVNIAGVTIASLKTPYYGMFHDGGKIEVARQSVEKRWFQRGMLLVAIGMLLQVLVLL